MQYINSGSFGSVVKAYDTHEECEVAIKCILRGQAVTTYVEQEIINQRMLVHPHIVCFKEVRTHRLLLRCMRDSIRMRGNIQMYVFNHR
jgi:hypothetical protein